MGAAGDCGTEISPAAPSAPVFSLLWLLFFQILLLAPLSISGLFGFLV